MPNLRPKSLLFFLVEATFPSKESQRPQKSKKNIPKNGCPLPLRATTIPVPAESNERYVKMMLEWLNEND